MLEAPAPRDVSELRSFLDLVNFYGKFPDLASELAPATAEAMNVEVGTRLRSSILRTHPKFLFILMTSYRWYCHVTHLLMDWVLCCRTEWRMVTRDQIAMLPVL